MSTYRITDNGTGWVVLDTERGVVVARGSIFECCRWVAQATA